MCDVIARVVLVLGTNVKTANVFHGDFKNINNELISAIGHSD